eukprot:9940154-Lingulodinium_polyedra.AAC.1
MVRGFFASTASPATGLRAGVSNAGFQAEFHPAALTCAAADLTPSTVTWVSCNRRTSAALFSTHFAAV